MEKQILKYILARNAKPVGKDFRLNDGSGLYLLVKTNGAKWWRFDYSIDGRRKTISLGVYPSTSLTDARRNTDEARAPVVNGSDSSKIRKPKKHQIECVRTGKAPQSRPVLINSFNMSPENGWRRPLTPFEILPNKRNCVVSSYMSSRRSGKCGS
ncbi:Arm DNA-binding domain-containing protein [Methylomonas sp. HW2-6]|uniref:Arm DNA-binding domain-containing protein n=1 Tax=Methylomonas sp. HW2-6 TaxID=3376687 RepID=UPI0040415265